MTTAVDEIEARVSDKVELRKILRDSGKTTGLAIAEIAEEICAELEKAEVIDLIQYLEYYAEIETDN